MGPFDWLAVQFRSLLATTHGFASIIGILIGVACTEAISHFLPPTMPAYYADRLTRLLAGGLSCIATFALDVSMAGFFLAILTGLASPTVHGMALRYINSRWPSLTPKALIDNPGDAVRPTLRAPENLP